MYAVLHGSTKCLLLCRDSGSDNYHWWELVKHGQPPVPRPFYSKGFHAIMFVFLALFFFFLTTIFCCTHRFPELKREIAKVFDAWRSDGQLAKALNHVGVPRETLDREYVIPLAKLLARTEKGFYRTAEVAQHNNCDLFVDVDVVLE